MSSIIHTAREMVLSMSQLVHKDHLDVEIDILEKEWDELGEMADVVQAFQDNLIEITTLRKLQEQARISVENASKVKDDFFSSMSHELRTPLTVIIGNCEYLIEDGFCGKSGCPQQDAENVLRHMEIAGKSQLALVNDILDMSKIESGKFTINEAPYNFSTLVGYVEQMFSMRAKHTGIEFIVDQKNSEEYLLLGDEHRIKQILINLVGNAIKFTEKGAVTLTTAIDDERLLMTVADTGIGIPTETIGKLFSPFQQADNSTSGRFGGSGLGLYISENLAVQMGGNIEVSSEEGIGSTFIVDLPYQRIDKKERRVENKKGVHPFTEEKLKGNVLIAEDTPELQLLERRILEKMGIDVTTANNGLEAVELANEENFDLILMDILNLPPIVGQKTGGNKTISCVVFM
jgi:two-component system, sensor histidine kinase